MDRFVDTTAFHLRLTINEELENIQSYVKEITDKYIICSEVGHFHCYIETNKTREEISKTLKETFKVSGNKGYSLTHVRSKRQMKKYILKDGFYVHSGYTDKEIECLRKLSVKKFGDEYQNRLADLEDKLLSTDYRTMGTKYEFKKFIENFMILRAEYGNLRKCDIEGYINRMYIKWKGTNAVQELTAKWFSDFIPYETPW